MITLSNEDKEKSKKILENIEEGLRNLKERTDFNELRYKERIFDIESALNQYRKTNDPSALEHLVNIFKETGASMIEGEESFNSTIWNANVQVDGKMIIFENLFWDLRDIVDKD